MKCGSLHWNATRESAAGCTLPSSPPRFTRRLGFAAFAHCSDVVAEDHHPEGGQGSAVTDALVAAGRSDLRLAHLAVCGMPGSGSGEELLTWAGIDAGAIAAAARRLMGAP
ncbi:MAG TPA: hypothetical protein VK499_04930 [Propionibacteriaceae bacterium]|nr:hypothetical protein [Propionibacteriaceae bacterium]